MVRIAALDGAPAHFTVYVDVDGVVFYRAGPSPSHRTNGTVGRQLPRGFDYEAPRDHPTTNQ